MTNQSGFSKKSQVLIASMTITVGLFTGILIIGAWHYTGAKNFYIDESSSYSFSSFQITNTGPNYFFPVAKISFSMVNPYADQLKDFHFYMSFDNQSWVEIPVSNTTKFVEVGLVSSTAVDTTVYTMWLFPSLNTTLPVIDSFTFEFLVSPVFAPQTVVIMIVLFVALFSFILKILEFVYLK
jgi:hypothetical protein